MDTPPRPGLSTPRDLEFHDNDNDNDNDVSSSNGSAAASTATAKKKKKKPKEKKKKKKKRADNATATATGNNGDDNTADSGNFSGDGSNIAGTRASTTSVTTTTTTTTTSPPGLNESDRPLQPSHLKARANDRRRDSSADGPDGNERPRGPRFPSDNHGGVDNNNNFNNTGAAGHGRQPLSSHPARAAGDRPQHPHDAGHATTMTPPSARRGARPAGASNSDSDGGVSSPSPAWQRNGANRVMRRESEHRRGAARAGGSGEHEEEPGGRGADRRRGEEGEIQDGEGEFDRRSYMERLQEDNRRIFAEDILALVERSGGPVSISTMKAGVGFRDLGMAVSFLLLLWCLRLASVVVACFEAPVPSLA